MCSFNWKCVVHLLFSTCERGDHKVLLAAIDTSLVMFMGSWAPGCIPLSLGCCWPPIVCLLLALIHNPFLMLAMTCAHASACPPSSSLTHTPARTGGLSHFRQHLEVWMLDMAGLVLMGRCRAAWFLPAAPVHVG
jgi:hypothetical protein